MAGKIRGKQLADGEITLAKMAANSVDNDQYVDASINNPHLAGDAVSGSGGIGGNNVEAASIDTLELANDAVDKDKIDLADNYIWVGAHDLTGGTITVGTPTAAADAATKAYVDQVAIAGKTWKELLLVDEQLLAGASGGVLQAMAMFIATNPAISDTFVISDGSTTETYTFKASESVAFDVLIGGSADATLTNLIQAINDDSALWSSIAATELDAYFAGTPANQAVVFRTATSTAADRLFSTVAVTSVIKVIEFATGDQDYTSGSGTEATLPTSDPAAKRSGFGRVFASIGTNDTHRTVENNSVFTWDSDDSVWQQTDAQAIVAGTGLTRVAYTIDVGAGDGINVNADTVEVDPDSSASATIAPVSVTANGVGVTVDNDTIVHAAGTLSIGADSIGAAELDETDTYSFVASGSVDVATQTQGDNSTKAASTAYVDAAASVPTKLDKALVALVTAADFAKATNATVTTTPNAGGYVGVRVDGIHYEVGDGVRTKDCYFSDDNGATAKSIVDIAAGDTLHWVGTVAGFELDAADRIDYDYAV